MDTQPVKNFRGINNRLPDFSLTTEEGQWLREAENVDIDNAGKARRRDGVTLVQAMTAPHSVFMVSATAGYLVRAATLYAITVSPSYSETLAKALSSNAVMHYQLYDGTLYYSNGVDSGKLVSGTWYPWGMATPAAPVVTSILGVLHEGRYQVATRYLNNVTGEAGGISSSTQHELAAVGALRVTLPPATDGATHIQTFVSDLNGSQVYLYATSTVGTATLDIITSVASTTGSPVYEEPMPPCHNLFVHLGRLCGASGGRIYVGSAYRPGYYEPSKGYVDFEEDITVAVPNQFGTYVSTTNKTFWLAGDLINVERLSKPLPYGGVFGTAFQVPHKELVGWFGDKGFIVGDKQGQVVALTQDAVDVTISGFPYVGVFETRGYRRVVSMGYCMNLESAAVSTYTDYAFASISGNYGTKSDGLYYLTGTEAIDAHIAFGKNDFGGENLKHLPACYVGCSSETPIELRVSTPDDEDYRYETRSISTNLQIQRIDPGKGLRANWYDLSFHNTEGSDFTLASVSFAPVASGRRI